VPLPIVKFDDFRIEKSHNKRIITCKCELQDACCRSVKATRHTWVKFFFVTPLLKEQIEIKDVAWPAIVGKTLSSLVPARHGLRR